MVKTSRALNMLALSAVLVPAIALADETHAVRISYADLDLVSTVGQLKLQHRIAFAAMSVCNTADVPDPAMTHIVTECRRGAIADARPAYDAAVSRAQHPSVTVLEATTLVVAAP